MARAYRPLPSSELLWELFDYKPLTGQLVWRKAPSNRVRIGTATGSTHIQGYVSTGLNGVSYLTHRLVWAWLHGKDPANFQVDHADRNRLNNTWKNLRLATAAQNSSNSKTRKHNKVGVKGVRCMPNGRYQARIRQNGVTHYLGTFSSIEQAAQAYENAAVQLHGEFFRVK
jgi:hypothetical protein